MPRNIL